VQAQSLLVSPRVGRTPGGNVTGVSLIAAELEFKRLSLLRDTLPSVRRVATLANHRKEIEPAFCALRRTSAVVSLP
jgi:putative tryptophan/tyrosine transport system substrate-binding protein